MTALRPDFLTEPIGTRYSPRVRGFHEGMARHREAVARGDVAYRDPVSGLAVFTARFLADRGWCCNSGCRHCPYEPTPGTRPPR